MQLFRAVAYKLHRLDDNCDTQPEVHVFFEAASTDAAPAVLLRLLALAWGCEAPEIEFYNLWSETELLQMSCCPPDSGDARLFECGHYKAPIFCDPQRTLLLGRPTTVQRLLAAQRVVAAYDRWAEHRQQLAAQIGRQQAAAPGLARRTSDVRSA